MARGNRKSHLDGDQRPQQSALSCPELVGSEYPILETCSGVEQQQEKDASGGTWHNDPELARMINERLAAGSD